MTTQRDDILGCACDLFVERGREGFSMRRLARSVGVTAPALYRHFDGKEEVLTAVVGEAFKELSQYLYGSLSAPTPMARLMRAGEAYLDFALDHPRFYEIIHAPLDTLGIEELPEATMQQICSIGRFWDDRLREVMDSGEIRRADPQRISLTMWAHAHGLISLYLRGMLGELDPGLFRQIYRESSVRVMQGVATDEGAARATGDDPGGGLAEATTGADGAGGAAEAESGGIPVADAGSDRAGTTRGGREG